MIAMSFVLACAIGLLLAVKALASPGIARNRLFWRLMAVFAAVRLGIFWYLLYLHWTVQMGWRHILLLPFLLPEGFLLPRGYQWTISRALFASAFLLCGSGLWALAGLALSPKLTIEPRG